MRNKIGSCWTSHRHRLNSWEVPLAHSQIWTTLQSFQAQMMNNLRLVAAGSLSAGIDLHFRGDEPPWKAVVSCCVVVMLHGIHMPLSLDSQRSALAEGDMSPVPESPSESSTFGVKRSRTLPTRKKGIAPDGEERARVLRKQKRASASQPGSNTEHPKG